MAKRAAALPLTLPPRDPGTPSYRWLYEALRGEILAGRLRPGARIPATREIARDYGLARGTIVNAFEQLTSEGYVEGTIGSGTRVSAVLPDDLLRAPRRRTERAGTPPVRRLSAYAARVPTLAGYELRPIRAFRCNLPALDLVPATLWAQVAARRLRRVSPTDLMGCDAMGYPPLRAAVADYLSTSRGVACVPEQIAIVSGVQEALDACARLVLDPGDRVCMENPGYLGARAVFRACGAKIAALPVDVDGMVVPPRRLRDVRLAYVTPGHQFPLGVTMSLARRLELLEWARASGALIFEDDYDSEYRYAGRPVPALQGLDRSGSVLFAGTFSKVLFPALRLGYLVLPPDLVAPFAAAASATMRNTAALDQAVLCDFIVDGHFGRHLRRMREVYAERLSALMDGAREHLGGLLDLSPIEAGLQTVGWLRTGVDGAAAVEAAAARGVDVTSLSVYSDGPPAREGLHLGFAAVDLPEIRRGVRELARALERC